MTSFTFFFFCWNSNKLQAPSLNLLKQAWGTLVKCPVLSFQLEPCFWKHHPTNVNNALKRKSKSREKNVVNSCVSHTIKYLSVLLLATYVSICTSICKALVSTVIGRSWVKIRAQTQTMVLKDLTKSRFTWVIGEVKSSQWPFCFHQFGLWFMLKKYSTALRRKQQGTYRLWCLKFTLVQD